MHSNKQDAPEKITVDGRDSVAIPLGVLLKKPYHSKFIYKIVDELAGQLSFDQCQEVSDELATILLNSMTDVERNTLLTEVRAKLQDQLLDAAFREMPENVRTQLLSAAKVKLQDGLDEGLRKALWSVTLDGVDKGVPNKFRSEVRKEIQDTLRNTMHSKLHRITAAEVWNEMFNEVRDTSFHKRHKITKSLMPLQLDDQPDKIIIPKVIWQMFSAEDQQALAENMREMAHAVLEEKNNAQLCREFLEKVKETVEINGNYTMTHHPQGVWLNQHHIYYKAPFNDDQQKSTAINNLAELKYLIGRRVSGADTSGVVEEIVRPSNEHQMQIHITVTDADLARALKQDDVRGSLHYVMTHPENPRDRSLKELVFNERLNVEETKDRTEMSAESIRPANWDKYDKDPIKDEAERAGWTHGRDVFVNSRKNILNAGKGADNRPGSASNEIG